jgi:hypothetical protein
VKVVVYTAVLGVADTIRSSAWPMLCFTDRVPLPVRGVDMRAPLRRESTDVRTARWHKWNAHLVAPNADVSVWVDGTHRLSVAPDWLVKCLGDNDMATFRHRNRDCVYDEAVACIATRKDTRERLMAQVAGYIDEHPVHGGLWETQVVVRRHCAATRALNEAMWREIEVGSHRDQVSLPVVARRLSVAISALPGTGYKNALTIFTKHAVDLYADGARRGR